MSSTISKDLAVQATSGNTIPESFKFKNAALNVQSSIIANAYNGINRNVNVIANAMSTVLEGELYKDDGFASLQEYAAATFGMEKASAHQFAAVGSKFGDNTTVYNLPSGESGTLLDLGFSIAKLAEIRNVSDQDIQDALTSGTLTADTKLKSDKPDEMTYRAFGKAHSKPTAKTTAAKERVIPTYDAFVEGIAFDSANNPYILSGNHENVLLDDIKAALNLFPLSPGFTVKQIDSGMEGWQAIIAYNPSREFVRISFKKVDKVKKAKKAKKSLSDMLSTMSDDEKAALLAALTGENA